MSNHNFEKKINEALNSFDNANRATPNPYLFTRLQSKMHRRSESTWDNVFKFLTKPAFAFAMLALIIGINIFAAISNYKSNNNEEQYVAFDDNNSSIAVLNDIENTQP
jgi:uncharacterized membrane protein YdfJ with MMPL/SSD domain